jgi:hypothetical protein
MKSALMSESDDEAYGAGKGGIIAMTPAGTYPISFNNNWQLSLSKQTLGQARTAYGLDRKPSWLDREFVFHRIAFSRIYVNGHCPS